jgi:hypothetical protein
VDASGLNKSICEAITGGDIKGGDGFVTIGHQVLFISGSLKFKLKIPPDKVKGFILFPV